MTIIMRKFVKSLVAVLATFVGFMIVAHSYYDGVFGWYASDWQLAFSTLVFIMVCIVNTIKAARWEETK